MLGGKLADCGAIEPIKLLTVYFLENLFFNIKTKETQL